MSVAAGNTNVCVSWFATQQAPNTGELQIAVINTSDSIRICRAIQCFAIEMVSWLDPVMCSFDFAVQYWNNCHAATFNICSRYGIASVSCWSYFPRYNNFSLRIFHVNREIVSMQLCDPSRYDRNINFARKIYENLRRVCMLPLCFHAILFAEK